MVILIVVNSLTRFFLKCQSTIFHDEIIGLNVIVCYLTNNFISEKNKMVYDSTG